MKGYLLISKLQIHNANAMSSSYTIGFPAMTAWLGGVHALQRKLQENGWSKVKLQKVAVSCHSCDVKTYQGPGDYKKSIIGTGNPLHIKSYKTAEAVRGAFVEEARCDLNVSFLIEMTGVSGEDKNVFEEAAKEQLYQLKMAGGDIQSLKKVGIFTIDETEYEKVKALQRKLMPGFVLTERRDLLKGVVEPEKDVLDALMDQLKVIHSAERDDTGKVTGWTRKKAGNGWLVPIAVGFKDLSGAVAVKNQRDPSVEHHFVEPVITLGEFKMPYRYEDIEDMMWEYHVDAEQGLYVCKNQSNI